MIFPFPKNSLNIYSCKSKARTRSSIQLFLKLNCLALQELAMLKLACSLRSSEEGNLCTQHLHKTCFETVLPLGMFSNRFSDWIIYKICWFNGQLQNSLQIDFILICFQATIWLTMPLSLSISHWSEIVVCIFWTNQLGALRGFKMTWNNAPRWSKRRQICARKWRKTDK